MHLNLKSNKQRGPKAGGKLALAYGAIFNRGIFALAVLSNKGDPKSKTKATSQADFLFWNRLRV